MNKTLRVERLYSLGDYKNIKITSELTDVPDTVWKDEEKVSVIEFSLLLDVESQFYKYMEMVKQQKGMTIEEVQSQILELKSDTYDKLLNLLQNGESDH